MLAGCENAKVPGEAESCNAVQVVFLGLGFGVCLQVVQSLGKLIKGLLLGLVMQKLLIVDLLPVMLGCFGTKQPVLRDIQPILVVLVVRPVTKTNGEGTQNNNGKYGDDGSDAPIGEVSENDKPEDERNEAHQRDNHKDHSKEGADDGLVDSMVGGEKLEVVLTRNTLLPDVLPVRHKPHIPAVISAFAHIRSS